MSVDDKDGDSCPAAARASAAPAPADLNARVGGALESLAASLDVLCDVDAHELSADSLFALVREVETASRRLSAVNAAVLVAVEADGRWAADGSRSLAAWVRRATDASPVRAHRQTRTARALRDRLPLTADALAAGEIGTEHAELLAKHTTSSAARLAGLSHEEVGEAYLVQQAAQFDAGDFARLVRRWAVAVDPEAADREWKDEVDKEHVVLAKSLDGYHLQGWLSDAGGAALDEALRARSGVPSADDGRTTAQRRAAALVGLARLALDCGAVAPGAGIRPHLSVHVPYETLERLAEAQAPQDGESGRAKKERERATAATEAAASVGSSGRLAWRGVTVGACTPVTPGPGGVTVPAAPEPVRPPGESERPPGGRGRAPGEPGRAPRKPKRTPGERGPAAVTSGAAIPGRLDHGALFGAAPAELDDGRPLPHALLARLACDSELARVVFGPASEILDSGRTKRLFTPAQRRAIFARDRRCQYPGCDAPPHEGEIHHSIWWYAQYGQTRAQDGVLLCWFHHDHVHANAISIECGPLDSSGETSDQPSGENSDQPSRENSQERTWRFRDRNGRVIRPAPKRSANTQADHTQATQSQAGHSEAA